jgi:ATP-dependent exoDNAse (exonuclease V) alpha subunit
MAIYHLSIKPVARSAGRSAPAAAAYRSATRILDAATGEVHDYRRKRGVEASEILLPTQASGAAWAQDRAALWNAAEAAEARKDGRVAREYEVALPAELTPAQRLALAREFGQALADRFGVAVDVAVHRPHREGDVRNHHAHLLATTRQVGEGGLAAKATPELSDSKRARQGLSRSKEEVAELRAQWAALTNEHLQRHGHTARVDHRSLKAQGIEREVSSHLGPIVMERLRRGKDSEVIQRIANERLAAAAEGGKRLQQSQTLERESSGLSRAILDTTMSLKDALAEREHARQLPPVSLGVQAIDERQQKSAERWREQREQSTRADRGTSDTARERVLAVPVEHVDGNRSIRILGADGQALGH